jgi:hypothetical protein
MTSCKVQINNLFLGKCRLLNSNLLKFYFGFIGVMTAGGAFTLKYTTVSQFSIVVAKNARR